MASPSVKVRQSRGVAMIGVRRKNGSKGAAEVPWFVEVVPTTTTKSAVSENDFYNKLEGKVTKKLKLFSKKTSTSEYFDSWCSMKVK